MKEIKEDLELIQFDGVDETIVYKGSFSCLEKAELKWRSADKGMCDALCMDVKVLRLSEIVEQLKDETRMITIFVEGALRGSIWQYGNYGDSWWEIGQTCGYA